MRKFRLNLFKSTSMLISVVGIIMIIATIIVDARLELSRASSAIDNVQSALDSNKPSNEVDSRIDFAKEKLASARQAYENL